MEVCMRALIGNILCFKFNYDYKSIYYISLSVFLCLKSFLKNQIVQLLPLEKKTEKQNCEESDFIL